MKKSFQQINPIIRSVRLCVFFLAAAAAIDIANVRAADDTNPDGSIKVGSAAYFTVLTSSDANISGGSYVQGNVGIGSGNFNMSGGSSRVHGNLVYHSGVNRNISGGASVDGSTTQNDSQINMALADATYLSGQAAMEASTPAYASINNINLSGGQSLTLTGSANQKVVLNLQNFQLSGGSSFTLQGTATTSFIINVTNNFSLSSATFALVNVPPRNVLFNILGSNGQAQISSMQMSGIVLALHRQVQISGHGQVVGKVIAHQLHDLSGGASVITPVTNK